ncbi:MAG: DNA repair protein RecO [Lachnospiraceae bacterium]
MIMSATPMGEFDKRIVILTKERGKISAFAKGVRKPNNPLIGAVNPFSFGEFTLYEGRSSYTIQQAVISDYFMELRANIEAAYYGFYFMEFANYYTREGNDERKMLKLIYQTMRILTRGKIPYSLIRYIFELKAVSINGEGPQVFQCVRCGNNQRPMTFSVNKGGLVCSECQQDVTDGVKLHTSTLYTLQYIISAPIEKLYNFTVSEEVLEEFGNLMKRYLKVYIDKNFRSLEILETILKV